MYLRPIAIDVKAIYCPYMWNAFCNIFFVALDLLFIRTNYYLRTSYVIYLRSKRDIAW